MKEPDFRTDLKGEFDLQKFIFSTEQVSFLKVE
jgi:hypothetical protein